ncbi:MAG: hypothetical protein IPK79_08420 [Vampirovibrionales bacterium]|nr:hypothetical protein [Vampirovibrionales bacterium]
MSTTPQVFIMREESGSPYAPQGAGRQAMKQPWTGPMARVIALPPADRVTFQRSPRPRQTTDGDGRSKLKQFFKNIGMAAMFAAPVVAPLAFMGFGAIAGSIALAAVGGVGLWSATAFITGRQWMGDAALGALAGAFTCSILESEKKLPLPAKIGMMVAEAIAVAGISAMAREQMRPKRHSG